MKPALIIINDKLLEIGMSQVEIDHLMARFLEEEAFDFVECFNMCKIKITNDNNDIIVFLVDTDTVMKDNY